MIKKLVSHLGEYKRAAVLTPLFAALEAVMDVLLPTIMAFIIDQGIEKGDMNAILKYGLLTFLVAVVALALGVLAGKYAAEASTGFAGNLRDAMYENIQHYSFSNIDKFSTAGLVTRMTTDVTNVQNAFQMIERMCVRAPVHLVFALFMAVMIGGPLSLIFVVAVVFLVAVLAGIMVSSLFQAGTSFIKLAADPTNKLPQITYWLMGSLSGMDWEDLGFVIWPMLIGLVPLFLLRWRLNVLAMGDDEARAMGVDASRLRIWLIIAATLVTAASVSVSGMIGWVGLVIPHMVRRICGSDYRWLMPGCMLGGGIFLLIVDNLSRNISTSGIPIGILTAFVGAPFFLLLITGRGERL